MAITQSCPRCGSNRIKRGYRPTPFLSKLVGRYHLLCDNCNWEFKGFAIPGTFASSPPKRTKIKPIESLRVNEADVVVGQKKSQSQETTAFENNQDLETLKVDAREDSTNEDSDKSLNVEKQGAKAEMKKNRQRVRNSSKVRS